MATKTPPSMTSELVAAAHRGAARLDRASGKLSGILSTAVGIDKFMLTGYYTLKLVYPQITRVRALRQQHFLQSHIETIDTGLQSGKTLALLHLDQTDQYLEATDKSARLLAATISEFRMITRLWGLLTMYRWAKGTWHAPPKDALIRYLTWGQIVACTGYQALENVAYLAGKGILRGQHFGAEQQKDMWLVSCRFWLAHTVFEAVKLLRQSQLSGEESPGGYGAEKEGKIKKREETAAWRRAWYTNAAYAPMALHYSLENGLLSDDALGVLGVVVGYNTFGHLWRSAA